MLTRTVHVSGALSFSDPTRTQKGDCCSVAWSVQTLASVCSVPALMLRHGMMMVPFFCYKPSFFINAATFSSSVLLVEKDIQRLNVKQRLKMPYRVCWELDWLKLHRFLRVSCK